MENFNQRSKRLGLTNLVPEEHHSKIITSIHEPYAGFDFQSMHDFFYSKGIMIYPGKLEELKTFRIANIGDITAKDIEFFWNCSKIICVAHDQIRERWSTVGRVAKISG